MKIVVTIKFSDEFYNSDVLKDHEVVFVNENTLTNEAIRDADILVCFKPFDKIDIKEAKQLKFIQIISQGIDQAPLDEIEEKGIILSNFDGGYAIPVSEWVLAKILESYKQTQYILEKQRRREWKVNRNLLELSGKKAMTLGTGNIAKNVAMRLRPFGVQILGVNRSGRQNDAFDLCYKMEDAYDFISDMDIVIALLAKTPETKGIIDENFLSKVKDGAVLINVARGDLIDEQALRKHAPRFRGVYLDVFVEEPLRENSPFWTMDNIYVSSHNSWVSDKNTRRREAYMLSNIDAFVKGLDIRGVIDIKKGY